MSGESVRIDRTDEVAQLELSPTVARELAGELGINLRLVGDTLGVKVSQRGGSLRIEAEGRQQEIAVRLFEELGRLVADGRPVHPADVRDGLRILTQHPETDLSSYFRDVILLDARRRPITPRTPNQRRYVAAMRRSEVVFGLGPAGTGKTFLAMALAITSLRKGACRKIILTRPAVEAGEKLGFLPGDLTEKVDPYLRPLFDALGEMTEPQELAGLMQKGVIEVAPLAFMRGRTLQDAFVVLDEAQNTTVEQMKMFLTRLGTMSRMVITGDPTQVDLPRGRRSGLGHAVEILRDVPPIEIIELDAGDVVRHPLVAKIIQAYERDAAREREEAG
ncbi:MAG TPA: PhoH family protein [Myxococcota bacterium]|nr:PhoH family protein [Myxococcota bacterium]